MLQPLALPPELSVRQALDRVLRLPAVASKRYLTNKVLLAPHVAVQPSALSLSLTLALFPHWRSLGSGNAGAGDQGILNDLCPCYQGHLLYLLLAVQGTHGLEPCLSCPFWFHRWIALWVVW